MDASANDDESETDSKSETDSSPKKTTLTDKQIAGLCLDFMVAGQETTANALAYASYLLSLNPDEQELLCEAIDNYYQENEVSNILIYADFINSCHY